MRVDGWSLSGDQPQGPCVGFMSKCDGVPGSMWLSAPPSPEPHPAKLPGTPWEHPQNLGGCFGPRVDRPRFCLQSSPSPSFPSLFPQHRWGQPLYPVSQQPGHLHRAKGSWPGVGVRGGGETGPHPPPRAPRGMHPPFSPQLPTDLEAPRTRGVVAPGWRWA